MPKVQTKQLTESNRQIAADKEVPMIYLGLQETPAIILWGLPQCPNSHKIASGSKKIPKIASENFAQKSFPPHRYLTQIAKLTTPQRRNLCETLPIPKSSHFPCSDCLAASGKRTRSSKLKQAKEQGPASLLPMQWYNAMIPVMMMMKQETHTPVLQSNSGWGLLFVLEIRGRQIN